MSMYLNEWSKRSMEHTSPIAPARNPVLFELSQDTGGARAQRSENDRQTP